MEEENTDYESDNVSETTDDGVSEMLDTEDVVDNNCEISQLIYEDNNQNEERKVVAKKDRISRNFMTKYEMVRIIGERTKQLTMGAKPMVKTDKSLSYEEIAIEEFKFKVMPFVIHRPVLNHIEEWICDELEINHLLSLLN
jgi:DNA-directed RNA polymerase subunit K/omega